MRTLLKIPNVHAPCGEIKALSTFQKMQASHLYLKKNAICSIIHNVFMFMQGLVYIHFVFVILVMLICAAITHIGQV